MRLRPAPERPTTDIVTRTDLIKYGIDRYFDAYIITRKLQEGAESLTPINASAVLKVGRCQTENVTGVENSACKDVLTVPEGSYGVALVSKFTASDWGLSLPSPDFVSTMPDYSDIYAAIGSAKTFSLVEDMVSFAVHKFPWGIYYDAVDYSIDVDYRGKVRFLCTDVGCVVGTADGTTWGVRTNHYPYPNFSPPRNMWAVGDVFPFSVKEGRLVLMVSFYNPAPRLSIPLHIIAPYAAKEKAWEFYGGWHVSNLSAPFDVDPHPVLPGTNVVLLARGGTISGTVKLWKYGKLIDQQSFTDKGMLEYVAPDSGLLEVSITGTGGTPILYINIYM